MDRISRDEMLMAIATIVSLRGTCDRKKVGAVISSSGRPNVVGYNGSAPGDPHCIDVGCIIGPDGGCTRTQHAEANAIAYAARHGISLMGSELHVTISPCLSCAKLIVSAGIKAVIFDEYYRDHAGLRYLSNAKIKILHYPFGEKQFVSGLRAVPTRSNNLPDGEG